MAEPEPFDEALHRTYRDAVFRLLECQPGGLAEDDGWRAVELRLSPDAYRSFVAHHAELEARLAPNGDLATIPAWGGKAHGLLARLAGILHCVAWAYRGSETPPWHQEISIESV